MMRTKSDEELSREICEFISEQEPKVLLKGSLRGQHISAVVYNGSSKEEANVIYNFLKYNWTHSHPVKLTGSDESIAIEEIVILDCEDIIRNKTMYKLVLKGEIL